MRSVSALVTAAAAPAMMVLLRRRRPRGRRCQRESGSWRRRCGGDDVARQPADPAPSGWANTTHCGRQPVGKTSPADRLHRLPSAEPARPTVELPPLPLSYPTGSTWNITVSCPDAPLPQFTQVVRVIENQAAVRALRRMESRAQTTRPTRAPRPGAPHTACGPLAVQEIVCPPMTRSLRPFALWAWSDDDGNG